MPEINLPTATKQDAILSNVQSIQGLSDIFSNNVRTVKVDTTEAAYNNLINISGKGVLTHLINRYNTQQDVSIKIDNDVIIWLVILPFANVMLNIPFNTALKVKTSNTPSVDGIYYLK